MSKKRKDKRKRHGKPDPVRVQIAVEVKNVPGVRKHLSAALLREAAMQYIETGRNKNGFRVKVIRWLNPSRVNESLARWKSSDDIGENLTSARRTLFSRGRLRGLLLRLNFQGIR